MPDPIRRETGSFVAPQPPPKDMTDNPHRLEENTPASTATRNRPETRVSASVASGQTFLPAQQPSRPVPPELLDEASLLLREADPLLGRTKDGRMVTATAKACPPKELEAEPDLKPLKQRTTKKHPPGLRSWFAWPSLNLFNGRVPANDGKKRSVTPSDQPSLLDRQLIFRVISYFVSRYVTGINNYDLAGSIKKLSTTFHNSLSNNPSEKPAEPEVIHLAKITLPDSNMTLTDVKVTLHKLEAIGDGTEADQFKTLKVKASLTGKGTTELDGRGEVALEVDIPEAELILNFQKGAVLQGLLEKGSIWGNLKLLVLNRRDWKKHLVPQQIQANINHAKISTALTDSDAHSSIILNQANIIADPPHDKEGNPAGDWRVQVQNLDTEINSHKMEPLLPTSHRKMLSEVFPYTTQGSSQVRLTAKLVNISKGEQSTKVACPELSVESQGDVGLRQGTFTGLTLASKTETIPIPETETGPHTRSRFKTAIGFRQASGDLHLPQATFKQPYAIKGPVSVDKGVVYIRTDLDGETDAQDTDIAFKVEQVEASLNGGIETTHAVADTITGHVDVNRETTNITIPHLTADHFAIGTEPDQISNENLILAGSGTGEAIRIHVAPGTGDVPELRPMITNIQADCLKLHNTTGVVNAKQATLSNAAVTHTPQAVAEQPAPNRETVTAFIQAGANHIHLLDTHIQNSITGDSLDLDLNSATLDRGYLNYTLSTQETTDTDQQSYRQSSTAHLEPWQVPDRKITYTKVQAGAELVDAQTHISLPNIPINPKTGHPPECSGTLQLTRPAYTLGHRANSGLDYVETTLPAVKFDAREGDIKGKLSGQNGTLSVSTNDNDSPGKITTQVMFEHLEGKKLTPSTEYLFEGVQAETDFHCDQVNLNTTIQPPEQDQAGSSQPMVQDSQKSVQTSGSVTKAHLHSRITLTDDVADDVTGRLTRTLASVQDYLPQKQWEHYLPPLLEQLEQASADPDKKGADFQQTVDIDTQRLDFKTDINQTGLQSSEITTGALTASLPEGVIQGQAGLTNGHYHLARLQDTNSTELRAEQLRLDYARTDRNPLPVSFELTQPAIVNNLDARIESTGDNQQARVTAASANLNTKLGVTGSLAPMRLDASVHQVSSTLQRSPDQQLSTTTAGSAKVTLGSTEEQLGAPLDIDADCDNLIVSSQSSTQQEGSTQIFVELGHSSTQVAGALNGHAETGRVGLALRKEGSNLTINPRYDGQSLRADFPNLARETSNLLKHQQSALQQSAFGQLIDLKLNPELDENLNGQLSLSAGGKLSPLITLVISYVDNKAVKAALGLVQALSLPITFGVRLRNLPISNGKATLANLLKSLTISFSSKISPLAPYAKVYEGILFLIRGRLLAPLFRRLGVTDTRTGEISLAKITTMIAPHIHLVSEQEMPSIQLAGTGDSLADTRNLLQIGQALPGSWNDARYLQSVSRRLKTMYRNNRSVASYPWGGKRARKDLKRLLQHYYPRPTTLAEFNNREQFLACLQEELQHTPEPVVMSTVFQRTMKKVPPLIENGATLAR